MSDVTPKAQELADEKGVDLSEVEGSGKDGRILVEDVEKVVEAQEAQEESAKESMEAEDPAEDAEVVGEVAGDPLVVSQPSPETSVEAFKAHPHVPVTEQTEFEKKDFQEESLATVEGTPEAEAAKAEEEGKDSEAPESTAGTGVPGPYGADDVKDAEDDGPGSQNYLTSRGERERGFYVIPDAVNPNYLRAQQEAGASNGEDVSPEATDVKPAQQESQVDTSSGDAGEPTHGESLREAAPAVAEVAGDSAPSESAERSEDEES